MHDEDNDGRFPDESPVEVRYPRSKQEEHGDRERWPWPRAATSGPAVPEVPGDVEQAVRAAYAASVAAGQPLSQRAMAERFGLSRRRMSQLVAQVTASGNGHRPGGEAV